MVNDARGIDAFLLQFPVATNDPDQTKVLQEEAEGLWFGAGEAVRVASGSVISVTVTEEMTGSQTVAIAYTIAAALGILFVFFWATLRQPILAFMAIGPVVLVLIWILGTLALLGIPYTIVTAIRHHGGDYDCIFADTLRAADATCHDDLGRIPEHAATFESIAMVEGPRLRD